MSCSPQPSSRQTSKRWGNSDIILVVPATSNDVNLFFLGQGSSRSESGIGFVQSISSLKNLHAQALLEDSRTLLCLDTEAGRSKKRQSHSMKVSSDIGINGNKGSGTSFWKIWPGRCRRMLQSGPGRYPATAKKYKKGTLAVVILTVIFLASWA